jgi:hypothetical protein
MSKYEQLSKTVHELMPILIKQKDVYYALGFFMQSYLVLASRLPDDSIEKEITIVQNHVQKTLDNPNV